MDFEPEISLAVLPSTQSDRPYHRIGTLNIHTGGASKRLSKRHRIRRGTDLIAWSPAVIRMVPAGSGLDFLKTRADVARQAFARFG